ncbi:MAG: hypothetical protein HY270_05155 [Deltaproteobacteria bacterium]|nr:hypothetical protein [Deltaproteobacteria bacterium]
MVDLFDGPLKIVDTQDLSITDIPLGVLADAITVAANRAYVANYANGPRSQGQATVVNLLDGSKQVFDVGKDPFDISLIGSKLYVASASSERVDVINLDTLEQSTISDISFPIRLARSLDGSLLYVGSQRGRVTVVDTATDTVLKAVEVPNGLTDVTVTSKYILVGTFRGVRVYDTDLMFKTTLFEDFAIEGVDAYQDRVFASTQFTLGDFLIDDLVRPNFQDVTFEPDRHIDIAYGEVRVSADGATAYVSAPIALYVLNTRTLSFRVIQTEGLHNYAAIELAPCPIQNTPTASPTVTATPSRTPQDTATLSPTPSASTTPTPTPTVRNTGSSSSGCSLNPQPTTPSSFWISLGLLAAALRFGRRSPLGRQPSQGGLHEGNPITRRRAGFEYLVCCSVSGWRRAGPKYQHFADDCCRRADSSQGHPGDASFDVIGRRNPVDPVGSIANRGPERAVRGHGGNIGLCDIRAGRRFGRWLDGCRCHQGALSESQQSGLAGDSSAARRISVVHAYHGFIGRSAAGVRGVRQGYCQRRAVRSEFPRRNVGGV